MASAGRSLRRPLPSPPSPRRRTEPPHAVCFATHAPGPRRRCCESRAPPAAAHAPRAPAFEPQARPRAHSPRVARRASRRSQTSGRRRFSPQPAAASSPVHSLPARTVQAMRRCWRVPPKARGREGAQGRRVRVRVGGGECRGEAVSRPQHSEPASADRLRAPRPHECEQPPACAVHSMERTQPHHRAWPLFRATARNEGGRRGAAPIAIDSSRGRRPAERRKRLEGGGRLRCHAYAIGAPFPRVTWPFHGAAGVKAYLSAKGPAEQKTSTCEF